MHLTGLGDDGVARVLSFHGAVGIENIDEERIRSLSLQADQIRPDGVTQITDPVTGRAVLDEELPPPFETRLPLAARECLTVTLDESGATPGPRPGVEHLRRPRAQVDVREFKESSAAGEVDFDRQNNTFLERREKSSRTHRVLEARLEDAGPDRGSEIAVPVDQDPRRRRVPIARETTEPPHRGQLQLSRVL